MKLKLFFKNLNKGIKLTFIYLFSTNFAAVLFLQDLLLYQDPVMVNLMVRWIHYLLPILVRFEHH